MGLSTKEKQAMFGIIKILTRNKVPESQKRKILNLALKLKSERKSTKVALKIADHLVYFVDRQSADIIESAKNFLKLGKIHSKSHFKHKVTF